MQKPAESPLKTVARAALGVASLALAPLEWAVSRALGADSRPLPPPVFIIGAPRTGSTILSQVITHAWEAAYVNNLDCRLHRTIVGGALLSRLLFGRRAHASFTSREGATEGWNSPSECGALWYRWFPRERHHVRAGELSAGARRAMRATVRGISAAKGMPLFFKNMNCGQRLGALSEVFPEALFIFCRRDPLFTAQSIVQTRERVFGDRARWWSIMPKEYPELSRLPWPEQVAGQIFFIERAIEEDLARHYPDRSITVDYETFCRSPGAILDEIRSFLSLQGVALAERAGFDISRVSCNNRKTLDDASFSALRDCVRRTF